MTERRILRQQQQQHSSRQTFDDRCRTLEDELRRKNETIESLRNEILSNKTVDLSRSSCITNEQSFVRQSSQRSSMNSSLNMLNKDREIAKLKAIIFQKDNEIISLASNNKTTIQQMEERMERERKVWNEHKELLIAGERAKFEEEKTRLLKELQDQLKLEQERSQRLEKKLYDAQMESSEAHLMLKESGRERINAVYVTKEQCRKEFQDEISRLRNQFQLEKDAEFNRMQDRIRELEDALEQVTNENADNGVRQHELFLSLEAAEKSVVRSINDCVKKLHMVMESPSHVFATIPNISSFTYERESLVERVPSRSALKLLQDTIEEARNFVTEQRVQIETKTKFLKRSKTADYSKDEEETNGSFQIRPTNFQRKSILKEQKENDRYFREVDRLSQNFEPDRQRSRQRFHLSSEQNDTIDNLVQKLEDHIATELDRLTKQRLTLNGSAIVNERSHSFHSEIPKKIKFEPIENCNDEEVDQEVYIRHLQDRITNLRDDNIRLRENPNSQNSNRRSNQQIEHSNSLINSRLHNHSTTQ